MSNLDIPAFLRLSPEERKAAWGNVPFTVQGSSFAGQRREEEAATRKLREAIARETAVKNSGSLERLKQWKEEHK